MLAAFAEVVGVEIDPRQGFFDAGATSMHIVRLRALLASRGVAVPRWSISFRWPRYGRSPSAPIRARHLSPMMDVDGARAIDSAYAHARRLCND